MKKMILAAVAGLTAASANAQPLTCQGRPFYYGSARVVSNDNGSTTVTFRSAVTGGFIRDLKITGANPLSAIELTFPAGGCSALKLPLVCAAQGVGLALIDGARVEHGLLPLAELTLVEAGTDPFYNVRLSARARGDNQTLAGTRIPLLNCR